jgi:hypothetical protein
MLKRYFSRRNNNPWELLIISVLFFVPGLIMVCQKEPMVAFTSKSRHGGPVVIPTVLPARTSWG